MDDEFALFAAEITALDEEAAPAEGAAPAGPGDAPQKVEAPPPPPAPAPAPASAPRPKVIAKAPEHVPAGPAARPGRVSAGPTAPHAYHQPPGAAAGTQLQRGFAGVEAVHLAPSSYPPPPGVGYHGDARSVPPPGPPQPVKKIGKPVFRNAGGDRWEDKSLADWPENDYRIFVGDLGTECTDETLARAFAKYSSFQKARGGEGQAQRQVQGLRFRVPDGRGRLRPGDEGDERKVRRQPAVQAAEERLDHAERHQVGAEGGAQAEAAG